MKRHGVPHFLQYIPECRKNVENITDVCYLNAEVVNMLVDYDREKLDRVLVDFSNATGININFVSADMAHAVFHEVRHNPYCRAVQSSPWGAQRCMRSDVELMMKCARSGHPEMHVCHAGLVDVAVPITHMNMLLGYIILGQMKTRSEFSSASREQQEVLWASAELKKYYDELPLYEEEKIHSVANIALMLTKHILIENMLILRVDEKLERVIGYIDQNLGCRLSVQQISEETNISKTGLYKLFRANLNCTLNDYITAKRVESAVKLLLSTDMSMEEISAYVGFSNAAYFAKMFKKHNKISPLKFRKERALKASAQL